MDGDATDIAAVREILLTAGLESSSVAVTEKPRCDVRAHDEEGERYLIEVKGLHDNDEICRALRNDSVYSGRRSFFQSNVVHERIDYAVDKQIRATPEAEEALCLIALINRTVYGVDVASKQIYGALYGIRRVVYVDKFGDNVSRDCLYFTHSAFYRHRALDAAIVIDATGVAVCLNDFGRNVGRVRKSALGRYFGKRGALSDAATLESRGFLWADCAADRRDEHAVLDYVREKYELRFAVVTSREEHSALIRVTQSDHDRS